MWFALSRVSQGGSHKESQHPKRAVPVEGRLQMKGGLKANLGRLETRLNCVELAKEQDTGAGVLYCYDCLLRGYFFSSMLLLLSYVSFRTLPIPGGPVCLLSWSPVLFSHALSSGHPYPCSCLTFLLLSGVGSLIDWSYVHRLCDPRRQSYLL